MRKEKQYFNVNSKYLADGLLFATKQRYYVFTNDELDKLVELRPKTIEELKNANILSPIKIKTHGKIIIEEINK